jgi:hypothetical protein
MQSLGVVSCVCSGHSFAYYITTFTAFIYIHVDIHRIIIIIITRSTNRYFSFDNNALMRTNKQGHASLCTKRREGVFRLRLKIYKFRPKQSNLYMDGKVKIDYKVWTNIQSNVRFSITMSFTKIIQMLLRSMQAGLKNSFSSLRYVLRTISLLHHHPTHIKAV